MFVYIAGKIADETEEKVQENIRKAGVVARELTLLGHSTHVPHWNGLWHMETVSRLDLSHSQWIEIDKVAISHCDGIVMMLNWRDSIGAVMEHAYAKVINTKIYYEPNYPPKDEK